MKITLKHFASLSDYLPAGARSNQTQLDISAGLTVGKLIEQHALPPRLVHLVLLNGAFIVPAERAEKILQEGDTLAIWPPIAGG